jgi:short-subunit dehydrogenase
MGLSSLTGRTAAVTGAARGIGRATAEAFVRQGMKVAIGDIDVDEARAAADALGESAIALPLDVRARDSFEAFLDEIERRLGPLDVLVNNAGLMSIGSFVEESDAASRRMIDVNAYGVLLGMKLALPRMTARGQGHVVNVASGAGRIGFPGGATYCATKFFVVGLSEAVHAEVSGHGVTVTAVCPGPVRTEFTEVAGFDEVEDTTPGLIWMSAQDVAREAVRGAERGKRVVVPGTLNRAGALAGQHAPRALALPLVKRIWSRV